MINTQMAHCLWNDFEGPRKLHLANWPLVCMKKKIGGLGVPNLQDVNLCLLASWIKRYLAGEGKCWRTIVDNKYNTQSPSIFSSNTVGVSKFWSGIMWAVKAVKFGYRWVVGDGSKIKFWEDTWFGTSPLAVQFWSLYTICNEQNATISEVWDGHTLKISFRRTFDQAMMENWYALEQIATSIVFTGDMDALIWQYSASGKYTTSSLYSIINFRGVEQIFIPSLWSILIPPRVHIFLWLLSHNKIMTRDNLKKETHEQT